MKLKDSELKSILAEVESELAALAKSEGATLRKAAGEEGSEGSDETKGSAPAEGSAPEGSAPVEGSAPAGEGSAPAPEASAAPGPEASGAPVAPPAEGSAPADPAAGGQAGPADVESLKAEYIQLGQTDPQALKTHYMAAKAALFEMMGAGGGAAGPEASAPPAGGPGPEASASPAPPPVPPAGPEQMPPPAMKAEMKAVPANGNALKDQKAAVPDAIQKSEEKVADLEKQIELLAKALELTIGTPVRKAVTSVAHLPKTEETATQAKPLNKAEVKEKIRTAVASGKLSKSEKDKLFSFTLGNAQFDDIKDLLDRK